MSFRCCVAIKHSNLGLLDFLEPKETIMFKKCLLSVCGLVLVGCAASPSTKSETTQNTVSSSSSLALQVMKADGRADGLRDFEVNLNSKVGSEDLLNVADAALLREHILGKAAPLPGVSNVAMSAFFAVELLNDRTYLPREGMWMPVWMPASLAKDSQEAELKMTEITEQAITKALPEGYRVKPYEWVDKAIFGAESSYRILRVDGPLCEQWSCMIRGSLASLENPGKSSAARMIKGKNPAFFHSNEGAYRFRGLGGIAVRKITKEYDQTGKGSGQWHRIEHVDLAGFDHAGFYRRFSGAMPDWAFIYFGPEETHNDAGIPFVLNGGKELFFVKPAASSI